MIFHVRHTYTHIQQRPRPDKRPGESRRMIRPTNTTTTTRNRKTPTSRKHHSRNVKTLTRVHGILILFVCYFLFFSHIFFFLPDYCVYWLAVPGTLTGSLCDRVSVYVCVLSETVSTLVFNEFIVLIWQQPTLPQKEKGTVLPIWTMRYRRMTVLILTWWKWPAATLSLRL